MLHLNTVEAIAPFIEHTPNKLVAIPGSVLSLLTQSLIENQQILASMSHDGQPVHELDIEQVVELVANGATDTNVYTEQYRDEFDAAVKGIFATVRNNIKLARGTVLPLIDAYTDQVTETISQKCSQSALALNIVEDKSITILSSPQLKSIVANEQNRTNYDDIRLPRVHADTPPLPDLIELLKTGQSSFDTLITNWVSVNGLESLVKETYNDVFLNSNHVNEQGLFIKYVNIGRFNVAVIALLLCWGLVKNIQDGIGLSLDEYKKRMEIFSGGCCGVISQSISRYERAGKNNDMVISYPVSNRQFCYDDLERNHVVVNGNVYNKFLEMGGRPEMVFGSYLSDRETRLGMILEKGADYVKLYNRTLQRGKLTAINNKLSVLQEELRLIALDIAYKIKEQLNDTANDVDYQLNFTSTRHLENANEFIRTLNMRHLDDYYGTIRNFICRCFFEGSMVLDLLDRIDTLDNDKDKDINELALVASVDLIVDWLISQVEVDTKDISLEGYFIK